MERGKQGGQRGRGEQVDVGDELPQLQETTRH